MAAWEWLKESKNQQTLLLISISAAAGATMLGVGIVLFQGGLFKPRTPDSPPASSVAEAPSPTSPTSSVAAASDESVKILLDVLARKEQADQAELAYKQEAKAWDAARTLNTQASYQAYLIDYPKGSYVRLAYAAMAKLLNTAVWVDTPHSNVNRTPSQATPTKRKPIPPPKAGEARLIVKCTEGSKLYVDGNEKGAITTHKIGSLTVIVSAGKHSVILVSPQGVLQQPIEIAAGKSLYINPPFCH